MRGCQVSRRALLAGATAAAASLSMGVSSARADDNVPAPADPNLVKEGWKACPVEAFVAPEGPSLNQAAAKGGRYFGTAVKDSFLKRDNYRDLVLHEVSALVCIYSMKWNVLQPKEGEFRFKPANPYVEAAAESKLRMRGHTLVWYEALPDWVPDAMKKDAHGTMEKHITTVMQYYKGRVASWDVVNEAVEPDDGRPDGLRNNIFLETLGPDYIRLAFEMAHAADPDVQLVYNCNGNAYTDDSSRHHFEADLKVIESLVKAGTPVHAVGLQGHLNAVRKGEFDEKLLASFFSRVNDMGLNAIVTELDASDKKLPTDFAVRDEAVAASYAQFLDVALAAPNVEGILTWGMSDRDSGHNRWPREDGYLVRGLPYDVCLKEKSLRQAMLKSFASAAPASLPRKLG